MLRDAEKQFKSAIKQQPMIGTFLMLGKVNFQLLLSLLLHKFLHFHFLLFYLTSWFFFSKVYLRLDQPLAALEVKWEKNKIRFLSHLLFFSFWVPRFVPGVQNWSWLLSKRSHPSGRKPWFDILLMSSTFQGRSRKGARGAWQPCSFCQVLPDLKSNFPICLPIFPQFDNP